MPHLQLIFGQDILQGQKHILVQKKTVVNNISCIEKLDLILSKDEFVEQKKIFCPKKTMDQKKILVGQIRSTYLDKRCKVKNKFESKIFSELPKMLVQKDAGSNKVWFENLETKKVSFWDQHLDQKDTKGPKNLRSEKDVDPKKNQI